MPAKKSSPAKKAAVNSPKAKVMDVAKPGRSAPTSTSKPIIVGHKPMMHDPMMSKPAALPVLQADSIPVTHGDKIITPPESFTPGEPAAEPESQESPPPEPTAQPDPEPTVPEPSPEPDQSPTDDASTVDAVAEQASQGKDKQAEADQQQAAQVQELVDNKQFVVPIGQVTKRRRTRWEIMLFILLVLMVAGFLVAVDAKLFDPGFDLPFDIIK